jgi:murein DD-endopeptidase MepM/ murein hydrolase activator NlpD
VTAQTAGLRVLLPGTPTQDDVTVAEAELALATAEAAATHAAASLAYAEYQAFNEEVLAAEEALRAAQSDAEAADREARRHRGRVQEVRQQAKQARADAASLRTVYASQGLARPAAGSVTSPFGMRVHPVTGVYKLHTGVDFAGGGSGMFAAADGVVTYAAYDPAYGNMVKVNHGRKDGRRLTTWYAHGTGLAVSVGQQVQAGQRIGTIGSTGYSTGPHLHFELRLDGTPVNPLPYLH